MCHGSTRRESSIAFPWGNKGDSKRSEEKNPCMEGTDQVQLLRPSQLSPSLPSAISTFA